MSALKTFLKSNKIELTKNNKWGKPCLINVFVFDEVVSFKVKLLATTPLLVSNPQSWPRWLQTAFDTTSARARLESEIQRLIAPVSGSEGAELLAKLNKLGSRAMTLGTLCSELEALSQKMVGFKLEQDFFKTVSQEIDMDEYPKIFRAARMLKRHFVLLLGPTNSGKTYTAMNALAQAVNGYYLAPLRLLALEGQEALIERGLKCNLVTGEEKVLLEGSRHTASTVEMCNFSEIAEVAVIDEVQMISDESRGWAWTAAICGVPAQTVYLVGSKDCLHWVEPLIQRLGDTMEIRHFERKAPLVPDRRHVTLSDVQPGDALIAFSRQDVLYWREEVRKIGLSTAVIYGSLSPEVRRMEARRFSSGLAQVLIATDAVGMGLNLPISRVVLTTLEKYDGESTRRLHPWELAQIVGRAGRYGKVAQGVFAAMSPMEHGLLQKLIQNPWRPKPEQPRCFVSPNAEQVNKLSELLKTQSLGSVLTFFSKYVVKDDPLFQASAQEDTIALAWRCDRFKELDIQTRYVYACAPVEQRCDAHLKALDVWMASHSKESACTIPPTQGWETLAASDLWLLTAEQTSRLVSLYLWLSLRFPLLYTEQEHAVSLRTALTRYIEKTLENANKKRKTAKNF